MKFRSLRTLREVESHEIENIINNKRYSINLKKNQLWIFDNYRKFYVDCFDLNGIIEAQKWNKKNLSPLK